MPETVCITGASSGIGRAIAKRFAADKSDLVLAARSEQALRELADELSEEHGVECRVEVADLSDLSEAEALCERLAADGVEIDVLVNNAGFGELARFAETDEARLMSMVQLNVAALTLLARRLLPSMLGRGRGGVLNVASTAAFQPGPNMAVYYATKAYVLSLSEALHHETRGSGVTVSCLCPGATKTGFGADSGMEDSPMFRAAAMPVDRVADAAHRGFRRGKPIVIPGVFNALGAFSVRWLPRWFVRRLIASIQPVD